MKKYQSNSNWLARWGKLLICGIAACPMVMAAANQPNVLFILVDDMGWGDLGVFYQNSRDFADHRNKPAFVTPHLDTMAAEGMQLRRHYCPAPVCAPSRASLLLGVTQGHANVRDNEFDKALEDNHTLASVMRQAGYATAGFGKWGLQGSGAPPVAHPMYRGFDYFFGYMAHIDGHHHYPKEEGIDVWDGLSTGITSELDKCYTTDLWTARTKKWIEDHEATNSAQPFFIYLAYETPHAKLEVPTTAYPAGFGTNGGVQWTGTPGAMINTAVGTVDNWIHPDYTNATWDNDNNPTTAEVAWPDAEKRHATMMRRLDNAVEDVLQTLKDLHIETNTLVIFTSDNGPHNEAGDGGTYTQDPRFFASYGPMDGIKRDSWEGGMREPTLAWWPGHVPAGTTNMSPSQFQDWMPTFTELAGEPAPARSDGVSLIPTLTGVGTQRESTIYVEYNYPGNTPNYTDFEASRRGAMRNDEQVIYVDGYKGIRYNIASAADDFQIYDTLNDPKETTNLAGTSAYFTDLQQRMKDRVLQVRMPGGGVTRPYDSALVPPVSVAHLVPGLDYRAFEDSYPWVPDFTTLTSVTNGSSSGVDLSVRTRTDNIGLFYTGFLDVPASGTYTIYLNADGHAFLRIHDCSVIDADFGYTGGTERSASIKLEAGRHPIRLSYIRGTGGNPSLTLQWSGPGISKQAIPAANLLRVDTSTTWPPTAQDDNGTAIVNTPLTVDVLANDSVGSGASPLQIVSVTLPAHGSAVTNQSGQIVYTPGTGYVGSDSFDYTITDGLSNATATVNLMVVSSIPPSTGDDSVSTAQNSAVTIDVLANDAVGSGSGPLRILSVSAPHAGSAVTNLAGRIVYTPNAGFLGDDTFTYTVSDGASSAIATVKVSVFFFDGLIWFPFNQTSGLTTLDTGGGFTGVLNGFAGNTAQWVAGKWNRAIDFNGVGNYLTVSNFDGILGASNRTCAAWIKTTSSGQMPVIAWGPHTTGNKWTFLIQSGHVRIEIDSGYLEGTTLVNDGQWHHVAVTFANDGTPDIIEAKLYVDGVAQTSFAASLSRTVNTGDNGDLKIGGDVQSRYFLGQIDEPRIYNRALSGSEMAALATGTNQSAAAWYYRYYGTNTINWNGDSDGDGISQLAEYAFGGNPRVPDVPPNIIAQITGGQLQVSYLRKQSGTAELNYVVDASQDLMTWSPLAGIEVGATLDPAYPGYEWATYAKTGGIFGTTSQYIRIRSYLP